MRAFRRSRLGAAGIVACAVLGSGTLHAQSSDVGGDDDVWLLAGNVAIPGLYAGFVRAIRGESFWDGFWGGMGGGAVTYLGKKIATADGDGLGLLGREIAAVGTSISRSAGFGSGLLDTLMLPVGPLRLYVDTRNTSAFVRVDLEEVGWALYAATSDAYEFRAAESLSAGAFVFTTTTASRTRDHQWRGRAASGLVRLDEIHIEESLPHELIHVIQIDQLKVLVGLPLEGPLKRGLSMGDAPPWSWVDFGVMHYPFQISALRLMETEADAFVP